MKTFLDLLKGGVPPAELAEHLDSLDGERRRAEVLALPKSLLKVLYEASDGRPASLDHLVPPECAAADTVVHLGVNSLPFFPPFQKIFIRAEPGAWPEGRLWGRNQQAFTFLTGPGYFAVDPPNGKTTAGFGDGRELVFNYDITPDRAPSGGWPRARPNKGLPRGLAFAGLTDVVRVVSRPLAIGAAFRRGKPMGAWFLILRES